jgi:HSP20 family molecular chaperone IbpA
MVLKWSKTMSDIVVEIEKQISRLGQEIQNVVGRLSAEPNTLESFTPKADIVTTAESVRFLVDLPGLTREEVQLSIKSGVLTLRGDRQSVASEGETIEKRERSYGQFYRAFPLAESVDAKSVKARFNNGVLEISFTKSAAASNEIKID